MSKCNLHYKHFYHYPRQPLFQTQMALLVYNNISFPLTSFQIHKMLKFAGYLQLD